MESLFGGQFTLSTQLLKPNYPVILPTDAADAAPQFFLETYPPPSPPISIACNPSTRVVFFFGSPMTMFLLHCFRSQKLSNPINLVYLKFLLCYTYSYNVRVKQGTSEDIFANIKYRKKENKDLLMKQSMHFVKN